MLLRNTVFFNQQNICLHGQFTLQLLFNYLQTKTNIVSKPTALIRVVIVNRVKFTSFNPLIMSLRHKINKIIYVLTITTVTVIAVEMAAHAHPCFICRFLDSLRNSSVLASMVLYSPNCLKRELELVVTEPSLDIVIVDVSHH